MDFRVAWSPEALEDVEAIAAYIARDSAFYASAVVERMLATARNLAHFPFSGPITPEWNDETIRERLVYSYRLIYRVNAEESTVTIAAVIHGRRLATPIQDRFGGDEPSL
jgi:plasmid stabilization system protein ParE